MHQLKLLVIIVVISGALCEDAVVLMAECPRTKLLNMDFKGKVHLTTEGLPTPNITLGGRIITTTDGKIRALTTLFFKAHQRYLCFDTNGKLHGELTLTDRCYFLENDVRGKYEYRLWQNEKLVIQFRRKGGNPPCSEFHKIDSERYHAVPLPVRAPNNINNVHSNINRNKFNNSLSTTGNNSIKNNDEARHRHRHGHQRKQVERRRSEQYNKDMHSRPSDNSTMIPLEQQSGEGRYIPRDRSKAAVTRRRKRPRGRKAKIRNQRLSSGLLQLNAPENKEYGRKIVGSNQIPTNTANKPPHNGSERGSFSNVHDEYSNDEPSAIHEMPIQNSLTDFLNPSNKKYRSGSWTTRGSSNKGRPGSISDAHVSIIHTYIDTKNSNVGKDDEDVSSNNLRNRNSYNNIRGSIASSQSQHSHTKKYYQNKSTHNRLPAAFKPDKLRRIRHRHIRNNDSSK